MSIIAYASANADPIGNPLEDVSIDLAVTPLGTIPNIDLYGAAVDSGDGAAVFSWAWAIVGKAIESSAVSIVNAALQDIEVQDIDVWGNVRLMLVATNTGTLETSETDPLLAPSSAFVTIRVLSEVKSLQKPAPGERNWHDEMATVITAF